MSLINKQTEISEFVRSVYKSYQIKSYLLLSLNGRLPWLVTRGLAFVKHIVSFTNNILFCIITSTSGNKTLIYAKQKRDCFV